MQCVILTSLYQLLIASSIISAPLKVVYTTMPAAASSNIMLRFVSVLVKTF